MEAYGSLALEDHLVVCEGGRVGGSIPGRTNCERAWIGPGIPHHGFSDTNLTSALEQSWLHDSQ